MPKIQCPHCKAVNQDVGLEDPCWQCGTVLSAPPSALDTGDGPATSEANPANRLGSSSAPIQKQIDRNEGRDSAPTPRPDKGTPLNAYVISIAAVILAVIIILVWLALKLRH